MTEQAKSKQALLMEWAASRERQQIREAIAKQRADKGIGESAKNAGDPWVSYAIKFLEDYLVRHETMHVDRLWDSGLTEPNSPRALGQVIRVAIKQGWIAKIQAPGGIVALPSIRSNMQLKPVWRSMIYGKPQEN